jgi:hypothetical protein
LVFHQADRRVRVATTFEGNRAPGRICELTTGIDQFGRRHNGESLAGRMGRGDDHERRPACDLRRVEGQRHGQDERSRDPIEDQR